MGYAIDHGHIPPVKPHRLPPEPNKTQRRLKTKVKRTQLSTISLLQMGINSLVPIQTSRHPGPQSTGCFWYNTQVVYSLVSIEAEETEAMDWFPGSLCFLRLQQSSMGGGG